MKSGNIVNFSDSNVDPTGYTYVSFDPGLTTGVAGWDHQGNCVKIGEFKEKELDQFLANIEKLPEKSSSALPKIFIIEEYRIWANTFGANVNSTVKTAQVIGQLKAFARKHSILIVEQRADNKSTAAKWSQTKVPSGHMPDWMSAFLHGYYYLRKSNIIKSKLLETPQEDAKDE